MPVNIRCVGGEAVTLDKSDGDNLTLSPHFLPGETFLIFYEDQARLLRAELDKMIAELWPKVEPEPKPGSVVVTEGGAYILTDPPNITVTYNLTLKE